MNFKRANEVYDILVRECGAAPERRADFVDRMSDFEDHSSAEYRFMGALGGGGKLYYGAHRERKYYVMYYPESKTPECDEMVKRANAALAALFAEAV